MALLKKKAVEEVAPKKVFKAKKKEFVEKTAAEKNVVEKKPIDPPEDVNIPFTMKLRSLTKKGEWEVLQYEVHLKAVDLKMPMACRHSFWRREGRELTRVPDFVDANLKAPMYEALSEAWLLMKSRLADYRAEVKRRKAAAE